MSRNGSSTRERRDAPVHQSFDDGHLCFLKLLLGITAGSVGDVNGMTDLDVVRQGDIFHLDTKAIGSQ